MKNNSLLSELCNVLPDISFVQGDSFYWSPAEQKITYQSGDMNKEWSWALMHEAGHASLGHNTYGTDIELLLLECAAWEEAKRLAKEFEIIIDEEHVQDCLDTYRDWLHRRSTCPKCGVVSLQEGPKSYRCINCAATWQVSASRFCRPYRLTKVTSNKKSPALAKTQATFR